MTDVTDTPYVAPLAGPEQIGDPAAADPADDLDAEGLPPVDEDEFSPQQTVEPLTDDTESPL